MLDYSIKLTETGRFLSKVHGSAFSLDSLSWSTFKPQSRLLFLEVLHLQTFTCYEIVCRGSGVFGHQRDGHRRRLVHLQQERAVAENAWKGISTLSFCGAGLPLARTRWVGSYFEATIHFLQSSLSSNQRP